MMKTIEESFRDWEGSVFGFGYGSGEQHTIPALKRFLELCNGSPCGHSYDYEILEAELMPAVAWLLINILCGDNSDIIEYGTSPRFGWLTKKGERLKEFIASHTAEELIDIARGHDENYIHCYPDTCNCGPNGYQEGVICPNPFWVE